MPRKMDQFDPQIHNLNNIRKGSLDDATYHITKLCALQFRQEMFWNLKSLVWVCDLHMQSTRTVWITVIGDRPRTIPVNFSQIEWMVFQLIGTGRTSTDDWQMGITKAHLSMFLSGELKQLIYSNALYRYACI